MSYEETDALSSQECTVSISTIYRRVQKLHAHKLLSISGMIHDDGKKYFFYKSKIEGIMVSFNRSVVQVEIIPNTGLPES